MATASCIYIYATIYLALHASLPYVDDAVYDTPYNHWYLPRNALWSVASQETLWISSPISLGFKIHLLKEKDLSTRHSVSRGYLMEMAFLTPR